MRGSRSRRDKSAARSHRRPQRGVFFLTFLAEVGRFPTESCPSQRQAAAGCRADKVARFRPDTLTLADSWDVKVATFS